MAASTYIPHKNGRPRREGGPTTTVAFRLTHEEFASVQKFAKHSGETVGHVIREVAAKAGLFQFAPPGTAQTAP